MPRHWTVLISDLRQISRRIYCQLLLGGAPCPRHLATCRHVPRNVGGGNTTIPYLEVPSATLPHHVWV